jgi:hypothetical protein
MRAETLRFPVFHEIDHFSEKPRREQFAAV